MDEDTDTLLRRARELVNDEFRHASLVEVEEKENEFPCSQPISQMSRGLRSKFESVKDARRKIRQEWEELKNNTLSEDSINEVIKENRRIETEKEILYGIVAYIEVQTTENHGALLKYVLKSLGATVKEKFEKEVTHVIFKNGSLETYKRAKLLNAHLVSPLWVDACKNSKSKVCERLFPVHDTNDYTNSPRVFRRFMEYQSKYYEYDKQTGDIIRKSSKNNQLSLIQNLQQLNICNANISGTTNTTKSDTYVISNKVPNKRNSSNESIHLHVSSDDSGVNNKSKRDSSAGTSKDIASIVRIDNDQDERENSNDQQTLENADLDHENNLNQITNVEATETGLSPPKRRLFAKKPIEQSFVALTQEERLSGLTPRVVVQNPYSTISNKSNQDTSTNKTQSSVILKHKSPLQRQSLRKCGHEKDKNLAVYNGIKKFNNAFTKTHTAFRPPSKYIDEDHRRCPSLISTSLHSFENKALKQVITRLGGFHFKTKVDKTTTHIVCGEPQRTINLLKAIARGCWVLNKTWVDESVRAGCWLPEGQYEMTCFSKVVQRSRIQKQTFGRNYSLDIFDDCGFIYVSKNCAPTCKDLKELIALCGGKVTPNIRAANVAIGEVIETCTHNVTEKWVFDSITLGRCKTLSKYYINRSNSSSEINPLVQIL